MPRTIAVTGATGLIGGKLIEALLARGDDVVALVRGAPRLEIPAAVEQREWSVRDPAADLGDVDAVVHLAGSPVAAGRWTDARKREIEASRILGTRSVVGGIRAAGERVRVLVSASGIDFHGDTGDAVIDESAPPGGGFLGRLGVAWEAEALVSAQLGPAPAGPRGPEARVARNCLSVRAPHWALAAPSRVVLLRTGLVLAREGGALPRLLLPFRLGVGGPMGSGDQFWPWIHVADEVGLILHALDQEAVTGPMLCAAPNPVRQRDFARALGRALRRPAIAPAPRFALRLAVGEMADVLLASHRVHPRLALETGYAFRFADLEDALRDLTSSG